MIKLKQLPLLLGLTTALLSCTTDSTGGGGKKCGKTCAISSATEAVEAKEYHDEAFEKSLVTIDTKTLEKLLQQKETILLDARVANYTDGKRIPGARSINIKMPKEKIFKLLPEKSAPIITYCGDEHCPASLRLAVYLHRIGYTNLKEYPSGIEGWVKAGNPVQE